MAKSTNAIRIAISIHYLYVWVNKTQSHRSANESLLNNLLAAFLEPSAVANRVKSDDDYRDPVLKAVYKDSSGKYKLQ